MGATDGNAAIIAAADDEVEAELPERSLLEEVVDAAAARAAVRARRAAAEVEEAIARLQNCSLAALF